MAGKTKSPVLQRANRLALMTAPTIGSIALSYASATDLRVLGAAESICRWRKQKDKVRVIRKHIERLRKEIKRT